MAAKKNACSKGGKIISVYDKLTNRQITIQSPACRLPWGVSAYMDNNGNGTSEARPAAA
jgi:hypothetical protein